MKKTILKEYAKLIAITGANIKVGDVVMIIASIDQPDFVTTLVEECYKQGAKKVIVDWQNLALDKLGIEYMSVETLGKLETFEREKLKYRLKENPAMIYLLSDDPDGLSGIDQEKYSTAMKEKLKVIKPYREKMDNKYKWCIAAVPSKKWAKKVFPDCKKCEAVKKLWKAILYTSRVTDKKGNLLNSIEEWEKHNQSFAHRCEILNSKQIKTLHYTAKNGTDFTIGLMEQGVFLGGDATTLSGEHFNPNIPTEEIFTTPHADTANGVVYSSMPLSWRGEIIDNFCIEFENGVAKHCSAKTNQTLLEQLIGMDKGAAKIGECAFVPYNSPIRESGIMFYETLFDENASCHIALGRGFTNAVRDFENLTNEEMYNMGVNDSSVHVDFMIGTPDMNITATSHDNTTFEIFKDGKWAF